MTTDAAMTCRSAFETLGRVLEYPDAHFQLRLHEALEALSSQDTHAREALRTFQAETNPWTLETLQEQFTRSFDLSPVCPPYLSIHLFGGESFKRAELMVGLADAYRRAGFAYGTELPDHVGKVLQALPLLESNERNDLVAYVLLPATEKMLAALEKAGSPWRHAILAVRELLMLGDAANGH